MAALPTIRLSSGYEAAHTAAFPMREDDLGTTSPGDASSASHLIVSPYTTLPHLLELAYLSSPQQLLAHALTSLEAIRPDYATAPYQHAFNWAQVCSNLHSLVASQAYEWPTQKFYIVVFRSRVLPTTDRTHLAELDMRSHAEATQSGGLLKYWFGVPDADGRNLATCVWRRQEDAGPGSRGPGHKAAMRATMNLYTEWGIERLKLIIEDGAKGWRIEAWND